MALTKQVVSVQPFEVRPSPIAGMGGFAVRRIKKGERLVEYVGERITQKVADKRYDDEAMAKAGNHYTLLFAVSKAVVIDATYGGNDSQFINHSCMPNCEANIEDRRVFIDALRTIKPGEELFYDYSYDREPGAGPESDHLYPCHCGTAKCRGTIVAAAPEKPKRKTKRTAKRQTKGSVKGKTKSNTKNKTKRGTKRSVKK